MARTLATWGVMIQAEHTGLARPNERRDVAIGSWDPRARVLARLLSGLRYGRLSVTLPGGSRLTQVGAEPGPEASVVLHRWRAIRRVLTGGDLGFARAWIDGDCSSPDLISLVRLAARNLRAIAGTAKGSRLFRLAFRIRHLMNANTKRGSARSEEHT